MIKARKINKEKCKDYFRKITDSITCQELIDKYNYLISNTKELHFVVHPERWLRDKRWDDEVREVDNRGHNGKIFRDEKVIVPDLPIDEDFFLTKIKDARKDGDKETELFNHSQLQEWKKQNKEKI